MSKVNLNGNSFSTCLRNNYNYNRLNVIILMANGLNETEPM